MLKAMDVLPWFDTGSPHALLRVLRRTELCAAGLDRPGVEPLVFVLVAFAGVREFCAF